LDNLNGTTSVSYGGQKIEVVDTKLKSLQGSFISYGQEMVSLRVGTNDISIPRTDVVRVTDRGQSRLRNALLGLGLGAAGGAGIGAATAATLADRSEVQYGAGMGMIVGMAAGTALGASLPSPKTLYRIPQASRNPGTAQPSRIPGRICRK
jgi:hypothetical protein